MTPPLAWIKEGHPLRGDCLRLQLPLLRHDFQEHQLSSYVDDLKKQCARRERDRAALLNYTLRPYAVEQEQHMNWD